jgi:hypothetical protein
MFNLMSFSPSSEFEFLIKDFNAFYISDFGRYVPQTESSVDESNPINERTQTQQKSTIDNIPSLMSLSITPPPPIMTTNTEQKSTIPPSVIKEKYELKNFSFEYQL